MTGSRATATCPSGETSGSLAAAEPRQRLRLAQEAVHARGVRGSPDDVDGVGRARREALYQRIRSRLGIRTGGGVIGREGAAESGGEREGGEQRGDPRRKNQTTAAEGELTEA